MSLEPTEPAVPMDSDTGGQGYSVPATSGSSLSAASAQWDARCGAAAVGGAALPQWAAPGGGILTMIGIQGE
jgi:hypothetical protein